MAYLNAYLEPCPGYGWVGGPTFQTMITPLRNGRTRRNADWSQDKLVFIAPFNNISKEALRNIRRMFRVCRAQVHCFRFRDEHDYEATAEQFGVGDGVQTEFQLSATFTEDGESYTREVYAIVSAAITANGSPASPTIDMDRGLVIFAVAPTAGHVLRWTGVFDIWVRFNHDDLPFSLDNPDATNGQITLIEEAPPEEIES